MTAEQTLVPPAGDTPMQPEVAKKLVIACDEPGFLSPLRGLLTFFRAGTMFYSFGKYPIKPAKHQTVVNLWHGMPLKTIGNLEPGTHQPRVCTHTIATSPLFAGVMARAFDGPQVLRFGQPRCDVLFPPPPPEKMILWLPTYRQSERLGSENGVLTLPNAEERAVLETLLDELGYTLCIKLHPMETDTPEPSGRQNFCPDRQVPCGAMRRLPDFTAKGQKSLLPAARAKGDQCAAPDCAAPRLTITRAGDVMPLLGRAAALITDYSSAFFDYLLLDRPIGFTVGDMDAYQDARGFVFADPLSMMPGEKLHNFADITAFLRNVAAGRDPWRDERRRVNALCNADQQGNACAKIAQAIWGS